MHQLMKLHVLLVAKDADGIVTEEEIVYENVKRISNRDKYVLIHMDDGSNVMIMFESAIHTVFGMKSIPMPASTEEDKQNTMTDFEIRRGSGPQRDPVTGRFVKST